MSSSSAIFFDRDGTLIEDLHYPKDADQIALFPGVNNALKQLKAKGYLLFVVSNQSGVGRGLIKDHEFKAVHNRVFELLAAGGVSIDEYLYCFHRPEEDCGCRKPKTGLLPQTYQGRTIDYSHSFVVGDRETDLYLADAAGARGLLVLTGKGQKTLESLAPAEQLRYPTFSSLRDAAHFIPSIED